MKRHRPGPAISHSLPGCLATIVLALPLFGAQPAGAPDPAHVQAIAAMLAAKPAGVGVPASDREAWQPLARDPAYSEVVAKARKLAATKLPIYTDDHFLDFSRTGNRDRGQAVQRARDSRLATLALAECLEYKGNFVGPLTETIESIAKERTWVMPAHDGRLENFNGKRMEADLRATAVAWEFATVDYLLADRLSAATRKLIHDQVRTRVTGPFREMVEGKRPVIQWINANHNWNAVCLAGVTGAALALEESPQARAFYVVAAEKFIQNFLSGFTPDGYCSEGVGYWNYGFGHFLMLSETVRQASGGKIDFLAEPGACAPAFYATRAEVINGIYPSIADCSPGSRPDPVFVHYIADRFGGPPLTDPKATYRQPRGSVSGTALFSFLPANPPKLPKQGVAVEPPLRTWFKDGGVMICRPAEGSKPFAAVLKGGHNAEHHNHNDVGSFSVILGNAVVICDPGAEVYTARTFSSKRYDSKVLSSYGHAVPVVAGQMQRTGATAQGKVLRTDLSEDCDLLVLDLKSAYPVPELTKLERSFEFRRGNQPGLKVVDEVAFKTPAAFETALITWDKWKQVSDREIQIGDAQNAVRVKIDSGGVPLKVRSETLEDDVRTRAHPVRIAITLEKPLTVGRITLEIKPVE